MICKNCNRLIRRSVVWLDIWIHCETKKDTCDGEVRNFAVPEELLDGTARVKTG